MKVMHGNIYLDFEEGDRVLENGNVGTWMRVCDSCYDLPNSDGCYCQDGRYKTVVIEFEVCKCCGNIVDVLDDSDAVLKEDEDESKVTEESS